MATLLGTDTFKRQTSKMYGTLPSGQVTSGELQHFEATYTTLGTEASGDVLPVVNLPLGAVLLPDLLRVSTDGAGGTSVVFNKHGDAGDDDRYSASNVALTAAGTALAVTPTNAIMVTPYAIDTEANRTLTATLSGTFPMAVGKKIVWRGVYRNP